MEFLRDFCAFAAISKMGGISRIDILGLVGIARARFTADKDTAMVFQGGEVESVFAVIRAEVWRIGAAFDARDARKPHLLGLTWFKDKL